MKGQLRVLETGQTKKAVFPVQYGKDWGSGRGLWEQRGRMSIKDPPCISSNPFSTFFAHLTASVLSPEASLVPLTLNATLQLWLASPPERALLFVTAIILHMLGLSSQ